MKNRKLSDIRRARIETTVTIVFTALFILGVSVGLLGKTLCIRDNKDYQTLQTEFLGPEVIATVFQDEELNQIYVCYSEASYVNVYDENGNFLWAVSTPYLRNAFFEPSDGRLIIYNHSDTYIYNSANGAFIEKTASDELDLEYDRENEYTGEHEVGGIYFDTYQVYKLEDENVFTTIVSRPWWHWVFNFGACWCVSFVGAVGIGITIFIGNRREYLKVTKNLRTSQYINAIENRKVRVILKYLRITSDVQIAYIILNILCGIFFEGVLCIGIVPLAIHFIISNIVIWNIADYINVTEKEQTALDYWKAYELGTFIVAFLSVIAAAMLAAIFTY